MSRTPIHVSLAGKNVQLFRGFLDAIFPDLDDRLSDPVDQVTCVEKDAPAESISPLRLREPTKPHKNLDLPVTPEQFLRLFQYRYEKLGIPRKDDNLVAYYEYQTLLRYLELPHDKPFCEKVARMNRLPFTGMGKICPSLASGALVALCATGAYKDLVRKTGKDFLSQSWICHLGLSDSLSRAAHCIHTLPQPSSSSLTDNWKESQLTFDIHRHGDVLGWATLNVLMPALPKNCRWKSDVCAQLLKRGSLIIGGQTVRSLSGMQNTPLCQSKGLWPSGINCYERLNAEEKIIASSRQMYLKIPLYWQLPKLKTSGLGMPELWGLGIPHILLQFHAVQLKFVIESLGQLMLPVSQNPIVSPIFSLDVEVLYLDTQCRHRLVTGTELNAIPAVPSLEIPSDTAVRDDSWEFPATSTKAAQKVKPSLPSAGCGTAVDKEPTTSEAPEAVPEGYTFCRDPACGSTDPTLLPPIVLQKHNMTRPPTTVTGCDGARHELFQDWQYDSRVRSRADLLKDCVWDLHFNHPCTGLMLVVRLAEESFGGERSLTAQDLPFTHLTMQVNNHPLGAWRTADASDWFWRVCGRKPPKSSRGSVSLLLPFSPEMFNAEEGYPVAYNLSRIDSIRLTLHAQEEQDPLMIHLPTDVFTLELSALSLNMGLYQGGMYGQKFA